MTCTYSFPDDVENHRKGKAQSRKIEKEKKVYAVELNVGKPGNHENWLKKIQGLSKPPWLSHFF